MTPSVKRPLPLALIVDDDATFRMLSRMSLEQDELRVEEAIKRRAGFLGFRLAPSTFHNPRIWPVYTTKTASW